MKMHCKTCGCHFDDDFEETLEPECGMWVEKGFSQDMSVEHKRTLFDIFFSIPVDAIADETGILTQIDFHGLQNMTYEGNQFEAYVPGYGALTDHEKRQLQKRMFKFYYNRPQQDKILSDLEAMGELDELYERQRVHEAAKEALDTENNY